MLPRYDNAGVMSGRRLRPTLENVKRMSGAAPSVAKIAGMAHCAAIHTWQGLIQALLGPDPVPAWARRGADERRTTQVMLVMATLTLAVADLGTVHGAGGLNWTSHASVSQLPPSVAQLVLAMAVVAPLPLAARNPMLAWRFGWLALLLSPLVPAAWWGGWPWGPSQLLALLAVFILAGIHQRRPALWWMWALTLIPWLLWLAAKVPNLNGPVSATVIFAVVTVAVDNIGSRQRAVRTLAAETGRTQMERGRRAVLEERTRIARELHDVVAHHMSLIAVRTESAPYRLGDLPASALAEFGALSEVAREALADMRRLLGVLRHDPPAGLAPQPRLTDLPALIDAARGAGISVALSMPSTLDRVPSGVGVCAYRIVQESLSNASRHAPGAAVTVSVGQESGAVLLRVANGPGGPVEPFGGGHGSGHGLTGMRERATLLGGSLSAGPAPDGGFVVSAVLPLGQPA